MFEYSFPGPLEVFLSSVITMNLAVSVQVVDIYWAVMYYNTAGHYS